MIITNSRYALVGYFITSYPTRAHGINREIKFDVTWSYVKRQTAKMTSEFVFFSSNPSLNHIKIEKCLLLFATNANIFTLLLRELKTDGKSFIFAVCSYTYDHVTANLISLLLYICRFIPRTVRMRNRPLATERKHFKCFE